MTPLLLLLLLSPLAASTEVCNDHAACLYFSTCYDEAKLDPILLRMVPTVNATTRLEEAVEGKQACAGFGFISTLSIVSTSTSNSTYEVSFDTDLNYVGFEFDNSTSFLQFDSSCRSPNCNYENAIVDSNGEVTEPAKVPSTEFPGRVTHSFQLQIPQTALLGSSVTFVLGDRRVVLGQRRFDFQVPDFWTDLKSKLACDVKSIHDSCNDITECDKITVNAHSLTCQQPGQLQLKSAEWTPVTAVSCHDQQWKFVLSNETEKVMTSAEEIQVICRKPQPVVTSTQSPHSPVPDSTRSPHSPVPDLGPDAQQAETPTAAPAAPAAEKKDEEGNHLPGNKWMWIAGGGALLLIIIIANVIVCILCRKKNTTGKKANKTSKRNTKKKGGKHDDSSTNQPSTSESKDPQEKPLTSTPGSSNAPSAESVMQAPTEMNLDRLKTEMIN